ncbi:hypothetical protein [Maritalea mediterranea]|uniref:Uncharacterized protein n=1 Tax=Maritalea mediterranea TaxID=2909667 RepID=A0ABS9EA77_9HYPH|nr:hypothetical protein [Maritalea mediterranea]MCF4099791.1 hypothetical protein [Maritalea mediterranea]
MDEWIVWPVAFLAGMMLAMFIGLGLLLTVAVGVFVYSVVLIPFQGFDWTGNFEAMYYAVPHSIVYIGLGVAGGLASAQYFNSQSRG